MALVKTKKTFLAQFTPEEFQRLQKHRAFAFLLDTNIPQAAFLAANILDRCVVYPASGSFETSVPRKAIRSSRSLNRHPRFKIL
jgi:hypothetical protein